MKRLSFWIKSGLHALASCAGATLLYTLIIGLQLGSIPRTLLTYYPVNYLIFGSMLLMMLCSNIYKGTCSLVISFGATRRELFGALQLYRLIPALGGLLIVPALLLLTGAPAPAALLSGVGTFLLNVSAMSLGSVLGICMMRFGKAALVVMILLFMALGGVGGYLAATQMSSETAFSVHLQKQTLLLFAAAAAAVYAAALATEHMFIRNYEVRI